MKSLLNDFNDFRKWTYCDYMCNNYGAHAIAIKLGRRTIYYSYDTIIAFNGYNSKNKYFNCIVQNRWGCTTGKHLNAINPNKNDRIDSETFEKLLIEFMK